MPSVVALRRWLVVVALLRLLSGKQASLRLACEALSAIGHARSRHKLKWNMQCVWERNLLGRLGMRFHMAFNCGKGCTICTLRHAHARARQKDNGY